MPTNASLSPNTVFFGLAAVSKTVKTNNPGRMLLPGSYKGLYMVLVGFAGIHFQRFAQAAYGIVQVFFVQDVSQTYLV